ncbi:MAG: glycerol-3-phosphate acyltransferase [Chloroflexi bacterium]|nr:glycerol-3-phosphate acyltransferase [Chloroflexota bacterium]MYD46868.1 glycerol-3-phosphate acyltransferase [Chloroflexota bacterium]
MLWLLAWCAAGGLGYLLGSLPTAYLVMQRAGGRPGDVRLVGDGNAGAANVAHVLGYRWGVLVGTVDIAKGAVPVLLLNALAGSWDTVSGAGLLSGVAAIAGHVWPVWLRFKGGRGAATAVGVTAAIVTGPVLLVALPALAILWRTRSTTLTLAFVYVASIILARILFDTSWGIICYCVGIFILVGAVHFWSLRFRGRPAESVSA